MQSSEPNVSSRYGFYGWYILGACFLILFFNTGARLSFGVMFKPMLAEFGWDRGTISSAFFLNMTIYALSLVIVGKLHDRYGPKWVIIISTLFLASGYALTSWIETLWQFYLCYGVLAAIGLGGTSVPIIATLMTKWFEKWRGLAISVTLCGSSLGQFVLVPLITRMISQYDWRVAYLALGVIMGVLNVTLTLLVIRGDPADVGQQPFGAPAHPLTSEDERPSDASATSRDMDLRGALRTPSFWLFFVTMFICGGGDFLVATHLVPLVTDHGFSPMIASRMLAWYGLMSMVGLLVVGPASDLIGNKLPIALTFFLQVVLFVLITQIQTEAMFYIFAFVFGFTHLMTAPLTPTLMGKLYGLSHVGIIAGSITTIHHLAGGLWAYAVGVGFDYTGSYQAAFYLSAVLAFVALGCSLLIREQRYER